MKPTTWIHIMLSVTTAMAGALLLSPVAGRTSSSPRATAVETTGAPGEAALRATINPETGKVDITTSAPGLALDAETAESLRRDTDGLRPVFHPNGAVSVHLQGRFHSASVAHIDDAGRLVICTEDAASLHSALVEGTSKRQPSNASTPEVR